ncbi:MAG: phosphoribosylamine--glycine ligase [Bacteroidia bacterium]|nr:phosphoribosylamine--glycine ligase [Bacteroidia bacterium]
MRILILGSGGRECAFAWKFSKELAIENIFIAPGNAGTSQYGTNVNLSITDFNQIGSFCIKNNIDFILPGGEDSLVAGIRNYFENREDLKKIYVFGPDVQGAMLEGSKEFSKKFMTKYNIPTARFKSFNKEQIELAFEFLKTLKSPYVIKADGLAAGKGVLICNSISEAKDAIKDMLKNDIFGTAGNTIVIEEFLSGIEVSFFAITDGNNYILLPEAKDYKRIGENDTGLNTGGMGAVSPVIFADNKFKEKVVEKIVNPTIYGLKNENINYRGFIFFGLINVNNEPYVIEYNCRMGDPETETVLPRLKTSLSEIIKKSKMGQLSSLQPEFINEYCTTVILVSKGYPGNYEKGKKIIINDVNDSLIFHAGTKFENAETQSNGGRVLAVTSIDNSLEGALKKCYNSINKIQYDGMNFRKDIGKDLLNYK